MTTKQKDKRKKSTRKKLYHDDSTIKPIPPKDYDGAVDPRAYHHFIMKGKAYLHDGKVHRERQIRILAHFLNGKVYNFYMQKVASEGRGLQFC